MKLFYNRSESCILFTIAVLLVAVLPTATARKNEGDSDRRCRDWAEQGECDTNPGYMRKECKVSCDLYDKKMGVENSEVSNINSFFELSAYDIDKNMFNFDNLRNKVTVVTNVASQCGYTESHYQGLVQLYNTVEKTNPGAVEILAFPCNQFGKQEPDTCGQIKRFAVEEKGVEFRMMYKINVNGSDAHQVYKYLKKEAGPKTISWNFATYFVIAPDGVVRSYSGVEPMDLMELIDQLLEQQEL